jgi:hypothetical protein
VTESMSKKQVQDSRTVEYWGGKQMKRTSSDLFLDRPRSDNTLFSGR